MRFLTKYSMTFRLKVQQNAFSMIQTLGGLQRSELADFLNLYEILCLYIGMYFCCL